jgi:hypothetical protein
VLGGSTSNSLDDKNSKGHEADEGCIWAIWPCDFHHLPCFSLNIFVIEDTKLEGGNQ